MTTQKLIHLPGTVLTPEVVLHRTLQEVEHISSIVVLIQWKDDSVSMDWSEQENQDLAMKSTVIQGHVYRQLFGIEEE